MDLKVTKQGVAVNETIYDQVAELPIDTDFTLPDYCPDIASVLKCMVTPRVGTQSISANTFSAEGAAQITILYADREGQICSFEQTVAFSKSLDIGEAEDDRRAVVQVKPEYVNCRAVTERKLALHGAMSMHVQIICLRTTQVIADIDGTDIVQRQGMAPATNPLHCAEKYLLIEDELELGSGQQAIRSMLRSDARAVITDCKIISNKVVVKGDLLICALYCPENDNRPQTYTGTLPFSQIIDMEGVSENCECDAKVSVAALELKPRTGLNGEARTLMLTAKLFICATAMCNEDVPVVYDAYCTKYEVQIERRDVPFEKIVDTVHESYLCRKTLEFPEGAIGSIVDLWCVSQVGGVRLDDGALVMSGTVNVCLLGFDADGAPVYYERPIEFEYRCALKTQPDAMRCAPSIEAVASSYTISGSGVEVRVELEILAAVFDQRKVPLVVGVSVDEQSDKKKTADAGLIVYFADAGEAVFDIARRYNTTPKQIMEANDLNDDNLPAAKMLLIPCV